LRPNQEDSIWNLVRRTAIGGVQTGYLTSHAAPSLTGIAVELAEQRVAVLLRPVRLVRDESFYLFTGGITKDFHRAEVGGIGLNQVGIELMLADDLAESIAHDTSAAISVGRLRGQFPRFFRQQEFGERANLFDRT
jgi:hypothetical protein